MKLTELEPRWVVGGQWTMPDGTVRFYNNNDDIWRRHGMGLSFDCPVCRTHRLAVFFSNPLDGQPANEAATFCWTRAGDTFETLSLSPSIDATEKTPPLNPHLGFGKCWHGHITNGQIA